MSMKKLVLLSLLLMALGVAFFSLSFLSGSGGVALFFVFPVFYSTGLYGALGMFLIFVGFFILFLAPFYYANDTYEGMSDHTTFPHEENEKGSAHFGGVILIGPIPIVFGSDKNYALYALLITLLILVFILIMLQF